MCRRLCGALTLALFVYARLMARKHAVEKTFRVISLWQLSGRKADGQIRGVGGDVNDLTPVIISGHAIKCV
jgi:hypothetical protein